jgi:hypothetical protein
MRPGDQAISDGPVAMSQLSKQRDETGSRQEGPQTRLEETNAGLLSDLQPVSDTGRFLAGLTAISKVGFNNSWSQPGKESSTRW